jgi:hypothetical protein
MTCAAERREFCFCFELCLSICVQGRLTQAADGRRVSRASRRNFGFWNRLLESESSPSRLAMIASLQQRPHIIAALPHWYIVVWQKVEGQGERLVLHSGASGMSRAQPRAGLGWAGQGRAGKGSLSNSSWNQTKPDGNVTNRLNPDSFSVEAGASRDKQGMTYGEAGGRSVAVYAQWSGSVSATNVAWTRPATIATTAGDVACTFRSDKLLDKLHHLALPYEACQASWTSRLRNAPAVD